IKPLIESVNPCESVSPTRLATRGEEYGGIEALACVRRGSHWFRGVRRNGGLEPDASGGESSSVGCGRKIRPLQFLDSRPAVRVARTTGAGGAPAAVLSQHQRAALHHAAGDAVRPGARLGTGRQDECLGTRKLALFRPGLQGGGARRHRNQLADLLQGPGSIL